MSGWIKLEKDRRDDPRVLRMAKDLHNLCVTHLRDGSVFTRNAYATIVLGCLDQLWCYADTHIREDDSLDLGADEIDEIVGVTGFCSIMPNDWLEIIDSYCVKLPGFHAHNGTESKRKALAQKRSERYRNAHASPSATQPSRSGVTEASLDQTRPDQTRPDQTRPDQTRPDPNTDTSGKKNRSAKTKLKQPTEPPWFDDLRAIYPQRAGDQDWSRALRNAKKRLKEGHSVTEILDGARRYAEYIRHIGKESTQFVKQVATFIGAGPEKGFLEPWTLPKAEAEQRLSKNVSASQQAADEIFGGSQ